MPTKPVDNRPEFNLSIPWGGSTFLINVLKNDKLNETEKTLIALALFVLKFAAVETLLWSTLRRLSKVSKEIAQALFSGTRSDAAIQTINRLLAIPEIANTVSNTNKKLYTRAFEQFKQINEVRNLILHHGIKETSRRELVTTDEMVALRESKIKALPISTGVIEQMTDDLSKIEYALTLILITRGQDLDDGHSQPIYDALDEPWLYKRKQAQKKKPHKPSRPDRK